MLEQIHITNLAVIEDTTIEFHSNSICLLGETGAGKSVVVNAILLLLGERVDFSFVRDPEKKATVSATFSIDKSFLTKHSELEDYVDDGLLIIKRVLNKDHTSRCYLNDEPVSASVLRNVSKHLIDIHSQNGNLELLDKDIQLSYIDEFNEEIKAKKNTFIISYGRLSEKRRYLDELIESHKDIDEEYLEYQIKEIDRHAIKENEIEDLEKEYQSLKDFGALKEKFERYSSQKQSENADIDELLSNMLRNLRNFDNTSLSDEANALKEAISELIDREGEFEDSFRSLNDDPDRIDYINTRLYELKGLQRKYGTSTKDILDKRKFFENQLKLSKDFVSLKEDIQNEIDGLEKIALEEAKTLSKARKNIAKRLEEEVGEAMSLLRLRKNGFSIEFKEKELSSNGIDDVDFMVQLNEGMRKEKLNKAASGGETSRLMLALKTVFDRIDPYMFMIFDEIDSGVSGKEASSMAKMIDSISKSSQVLVITHLPQVAVFADEAILIRKSSDNGITTTKAIPLGEKEFITQVSSMISDGNITDAAIKQVKELRKAFKN